jgi:cytochrome c peroxidase
VRRLFCIGALLVAIGCSPIVASTFANAENPVLDDAAKLEALKTEYRRPPDVPSPPDNSYSRERSNLGKSLFFDPRLSGSGIISCASCHNPGLGWADGLQTGLGNMGSHLTRRTPTIENLAWGGPYFWDGRAETLEEQAKGPLQSPTEMNKALLDVTQTVTSIAGYRSAFAAAYPGEPLNIDTIAKAIANFERTVVSGQAPFDRWVEGDEHAISDAAKRGFLLFDGKANCATCHSGWRFTDDGFHDIGVKSDDKGRGAVVTGIPALDHAFKTPTLRNVALRAPYQHDGSERTLRDVIDFYDGEYVNRESLSSDIKRLNLSDREKDDLVAFMQTLTGNDPVVLPLLPQAGALAGR